MFQRNKDETQGEHGAASMREGVRRPQAAVPPPAPPRLPEPRFHPDIPNLRPESGGREHPVSTESKRLTVGQDITLSGEITACDKLLVEGTVEVDLHEARELQILRPGRFTGTATVEDADIAGEFSGKLVATGRLVVRASGRVRGEIRYGSLKIEEGGELEGTVAPQNEDKSKSAPAEGGAARSAAE